MTKPTLAQIVANKPYPDYADWWAMGSDFIAFMAEAIGSEWRALNRGPGDLIAVQHAVDDYIKLVYARAARPTLVADFVQGRGLSTMQSGEFDALSYAFFKDAYTKLAAAMADDVALDQARHTFTQRVGRRFYNQLHEHLALCLPQQLAAASDLATLQAALTRVGNFLQEQGYLRDHFAFTFDVHAAPGGRQIEQTAADVISQLQDQRTIYALYEMGYPAILPSAVYLYHTVGEAQHHSSRTIEELFGRIGYRASETADFDPTGYPSDLVVELWEIVAQFSLNRPHHCSSSAHLLV